MPEHVFDRPDYLRDARTSDERRAGTSLEQFGAAVQTPAGRRLLGLDITESTAASTADDPASLRSLYERWIATGTAMTGPSGPGDDRYDRARTVVADNPGIATPDGRATPQHDRLPLMRKQRLAWAAIVPLLLAAVWVFTAPEEALNAPTDWSQELRSAESRFDANDARTEGAPQQQVVNGWYSNDLAAIQVAQLAAQQDQADYGHALEARTAALLALLVLAFAGDLALRAFETSPRRHPRMASATV